MSRKLRIYGFNEIKNVWFEEDTLLLHDLCAILDEENTVIYLWDGSKISSERLEKGNTGLIVSIGILFYLSQGIFLFLFQPGSDSTTYVILQMECTILFLFLLLSKLIYLIPTIYKFIIFTLKYQEFII